MSILRTVYIYVGNDFAGELCETDEGFRFSYDQNYLENPAACDVSLTMPLQSDAYESKTMFPFFDGLIPEGWMLEVTIRNWKLDERDRFGILSVACEDCVGRVSVHKEKC